MGLAELEQPKPEELERPKPEASMVEVCSSPAGALRLEEFALLERLRSPRPVFPPVEEARLRCVELVPRRLELLALQPGDCRYPYGDGEEEAITFCGHPRRQGSSYCTPHFHLSRNPDIPFQRAPSAVSLRIVAGGGTIRVKEVRHGTQEAQEDLRSFESL